MPNTIAPAAACRHQRPAARWATQVARGTSRKPTTYEAQVHGAAPIQEELGRIIAALIATRDPLLGKVLAPIEAALAEMPLEDLTPAVILAAQLADLAEDEAEGRYLTTPTREHLRAWRLALEAQRTESLRLHRAMLLEEGR
jgi:hypothetical protein